MKIRTRHVFGPASVHKSRLPFLEVDQVAHHVTRRCSVCREKWATMILESRPGEALWEDEGKVRARAVAEIVAIASERIGATSWCYPDPRVRAIVNWWRSVRRWWTMRTEQMRPKANDEGQDY